MGKNFLSFSFLLSLFLFHVFSQAWVQYGEDWKLQLWNQRQNKPSGSSGCLLRRFMLAVAECPQTGFCYSLAMDYCPFFILFGGNMPLQGFGDTRGDRASAHSQGTAGQTQLLRGGKAIFSFLYIYIPTYKKGSFDHQPNILFWIASPGSRLAANC